MAGKHTQTELFQGEADKEAIQADNGAFQIRTANSARGLKTCHIISHP
ncbi:hypothetical protein C8P68_101635 [Mucilaginibacter yixingensis]|uniref:Uncharacterized protein n=1 Tax=Mucilaginibacter yixingensis TaxID=1295612 RepID=A0A2T5JG55_9SPHI|nr:hypothetical protein C8P68_101635 [Mucilaginibacter yixingensis]